MSEMEFHSGNAKRFPRIEGESNAAYAERFAKETGLTFSQPKEEILSEIFEELDLGGPWRHQTAIVVNDEIWQLIVHKKQDEPPEVMEFSPLPDGSYSFAYYFYNGGTCLPEVLESSIDKLEQGGNFHRGNRDSLADRRRAAEVAITRNPWHVSPNLGMGRFPLSWRGMQSSRYMPAIHRTCEHGAEYATGRKDGRRSGFVRARHFRVAIPLASRGGGE